MEYKPAFGNTDAGDGYRCGDLSTVLLCSVPPAQANYLQRIGRAGRKDGNALNITVAEGNPHDQFFFEEPLEMMQRAGTGPRCVPERNGYPGASAGRILHGQLGENRRPGICYQQKREADAGRAGFGHKSGFPYNFLRYVEQHHADIAQQFSSIFPDLTEDTRLQLLSYFRGHRGSVLWFNVSNKH